MHPPYYPIVIVGGGAAGFFAAITCAQHQKQRQVILLEKGHQVLGKVKISGGGRCNVTHACFDVAELVKNYPRGANELIGPFNRFNPSHTIQWFAQHGVTLKTEPDGRMFPTTNSSQTIIDCLTAAAQEHGVLVHCRCGVTGIEPPENEQKPWLIHTANGKQWQAHKLIIAAGSSAHIWQLLAALGHTIVLPVPSLFTFNLAPNHPFGGLEGVAVAHVAIKVKDTKLSTSGSLLFTHWGISGPATLRLSAFGAQVLHQKNYQFEVLVNWLGNTSGNEAELSVSNYKTEHSKQQVSTHALFGLPSRLWKRLTEAAQIAETHRWADVSKKQLRQLTNQLTQTALQVVGKSAFKEEFVTCGGVALNEVNFKTMESRLHPRLYFAGETLNIDAVTGGFNFQAAWTCGFIAGYSMAQPD